MNDQLDDRQSVEILDPLPEVTSPADTTRANTSAPLRTAPRRAIRTASQDNEADSEDDSFIGRHRYKLTSLVVITVGSLMTWFILQPKTAPIRRAPERMVMIQPLPPPPVPPPPPPPPKIQPPPEQKMIEQAPLEEKQPEPEPKPLDEPPPILGTGIKGDGPADGFGLGSSGNGGGGGGSGLGGYGRGGGKWDNYARRVQSAIAEALRTNPKSRAAKISGLEVRIWPDSTGRVSRSQLVGSTGDPSLDQAIRNEVLTGLQLPEPQPQGMPSPIVLRLNARRPN